MKKSLIILTYIALFSASAFAQSAYEVKEANKEFSSYDYLDAIARYEKFPVKNTDVKRKLAQSYQMTGNTVKAEEYYKGLVDTQGRQALDLYNYATVLKTNGKYSEAAEWVEKYNSIAHADSLTETLPTGYEKDLLEDKGRFTIKNLDVNSAQEDFSAVYYAGKVVFASSRRGIKPTYRSWNGNHLPFLDLYLAEPNEQGELNNLLHLKKVNKKYHEGPASFSKDGNIMVFTRNNYEAKSKDGIRKLQLFESKMKDGEWGLPVAIPFNSNEYSVGQPALTEDGNTMYFASDMPGGKGRTDIYVSKRNSDGSWGKPESMGEEINTEGQEMFPFIHESGLFLFSSDGLPGLGGLDIFVTEIKDNKAGKVVNVGVPVNGSKDDFSFVLNKESKAGYFSSNREGGKGDDDIYSFNLLKPFTFGKIIKGVAKDKSGTILENTAVSLKDDKGNVVQTIRTGKDGAYSFSAEPNKDFSLNGNKEKYFDGNNMASTKTEKDVIISNLVLEKDPGLSLYALVTDQKTKAPLDGVKMTLTDKTTGSKDTITTDSLGDYLKPLAENKLNDKIDYELKLEKPGYITKTVTYTQLLDHEGRYDVHGALDLGMHRLAVGDDIGKLIDINPIYFDLNKFNIRKDAAVELEKIVKIMKEYPTMVIELGSHTDCRATAAYNLNLSDHRAKASAAYIKKEISKPERIYGKGYGETQLINDCACEGKVKSACSEAEHQKNRRTEFKIIKM